MATEVLNELAIVLGIDASDLEQGIAKAVAKVQEIGSQAQSAVADVASVVTSTSGQAVASSKAVSESMDDLGKASKNAADKAKSSFGGLPNILTGVRGQILSLVSALGASLGSAIAFNDFVNGADALGKLSERTGVAVSELDAWSKANEQAGGSAQALQDNLERFYRKSGKGAEEFFKLGEQISGMSQKQAAEFLRLQGVALDAVPILRMGQKEANELLEKYRKTAFTAEDARLASEFNDAWDDFKDVAKAVAAIAIRAVLPALTSLGKVLQQMMVFVRENARLFKILGGILLAAFGVKLLTNIKSAIMAVKAFGLAFKGALLPITAIAAAVIAIGLALEDLFVFAKGGDSAIEKMMRKFGIGKETIETVRTAFAGLFDALESAWKAIAPVLTTVLGGLLKAIAGILTGIAAIIAGIVAGVAVLLAKFAEFFSNLKQWAAEAGSILKDAFQTAVDWIASLFTGLWEKIISGFEKVKSFLKNPIGSIGSAIKGLFSRGDDKGAPQTATSAQQAVLREQIATGGGSVQTTQTMNQTVNITTRDDPTDIAKAVGRSTSGATGQMNRNVQQAARGMRLK